MKFTTIAAAAIAALMMAGGASAATVTCDAATDGKVTGTSACEYSNDVPNGNDSPLNDFLDETWFMISDWDFAAKDNGPDGTTDEGSGLTISVNTGGDDLRFAGDWEIDNFSASKDFMLVFKGGSNMNPAPLIAYLASEGNGTYSTPFTGNNDQETAISHISLYTNVSSIPLPAAGWLLLAGIGGLAALRRRKTA